MDVHNKVTRSYNMSKIKGKNTKPEQMVSHYLFSEGFRYRLNVKRLPGSPDIVLKKYKTVIFVNGCFWHMHDCRYFVMPETNTAFWNEKLITNKNRDIKNYDYLKKLSWNVIIIWECELKHGKKEITLKNLVSKIKNNN